MTPEQDKPHFARAAEILSDIKKKAGIYAYLFFFWTQAQLNAIFSSKGGYRTTHQKGPIHADDKESLQQIARKIAKTQTRSNASAASF